MAPFRRLRCAVRMSPALVVALLAMMLSVAGNAAAALIITSNSQVAQNTISGHHPPSGDHANLIVGSVNGTDVANDSLTGADVNEASLKAVNRKLYWTASASVALVRTTIATVGSWTIKANCTDDSGAVFVSLTVDGPGRAEYGYERTLNNLNATTNSNATVLHRGSDTALIGEEVSGTSGRWWGTAMLHAGTSVAQVSFFLIADGLNAPHACFLYGTATLGV